MLRSVKVQDYMSTQLITFKPETDLFQAINIFTEHNISGAPVVDDRGEMIGMLSEVDCLKSILSYTYHEEEKGGNVGDFMTDKVDTVKHDEDIVNLADKFINGPRRRFPVLKDGKLVGQISRKDVLRAVKEFVGQEQN
ncbi:CBS domain-containing protein [Motiliproteus sp. MSK22-1]|uniref:CBS domain-containing protein n=1 Tax=Motiliproteus sp. MSK22-1 TaxID=1897630 RepID=UPI00097800AC|nr:CBS domain-containing protein [Motiliproteus sp. MSK22-1]OMH33955.1 CBS domain-containing protein [Motiliproteus sp. MSK22-1]